jgi:ribosomal protein S18 acetylase RimI-like enzyme
MMDFRAARELDEIAGEVIAGTAQADIAGWIAKASPDLPFRRANVTLPPIGAGRSRASFDSALDQVARWYRAQGVPLRVQVSTADPTSLEVDRWLGDRGLVIEAPVQVLVAGRHIGGSPAVPPAVTLVTVTGPDVTWVETHRLDGLDDAAHRRSEAYARVLAPLGDRAVAVAAHTGDVVVGIGFGAVHRGQLAIFGMATAPRWRRRGVASAVVAGLEAAGRAQGVGGAFLQVEVGNEAAIACYRRLGYRASHGYHYRSALADP